MSIIKFNFKQHSRIKPIFPAFFKNEENTVENIGNTKKDFIPLQTIGEIPVGKIIKVKSKINNKIYTMKIFKIENQTAATQEINILIRFKHPNIIKYYKNFKDNKNCYIILEYVKGQTLIQLYNSYKIQKKQNEEKKVWNILDQCIQTIIDIHGQGIIHRNIQFSNIILDEKNKIRIIDFNSSAFMDDSSANANGNNCKSMVNHGTNITNDIGAPEITTGNYNAKVDVYPLGKIFSIFCSNEQINKYSDELLTIIDKMIIENPEQRPTINEIYEKTHFQKYYLIKYYKYSSIFPCFHCLFNYPIWTKIIENNKKIKNKYLNSFLKLFTIINKNEFEMKVRDFKRQYLKIIFENNDELQEIKPISFINYNFAILNEELNSIKEENKRKYKNVKDEILKYEKYINYTKKYKSNIKSDILENFFGTLKLKIVCKDCKSKKYYFNYFSHLSFNIDYLISKGNDLNYKNVFQPLIFNRINKQIFCDYCKKETNHEETIAIYEAPKNFIIFFNKKNNNSNQLMNRMIINFDEIIILDKNYIESFLTSNKEIHYCLYAILCQITNNGNDTIYISFTRDEDRSHNNKSKYYSLNQIKDKKNNFDIIGLFYYSDKQKKQNDYIIGQNIYKLNESQQNNYIF